MPPYKRQGGVRQHALALQAEAPSSVVPVPVPTSVTASVRKRKMDDVPPSIPGINITAYQEHLKQLFIMNKGSAKDIHTSADLSEGAGAHGVSKLVACGKEGERPGNLKRDMRRKLEKNTDMPKCYWAHVRGHNPLTGENQYRILLPFLLISEMLIWLLQTSRIAIASACALTGSGRVTRHAKFCKEHKLKEDAVFSLGQHMDGVPFCENQSVEAMSWNIVGLPLLERMLFCLLEKNTFAPADAMGGIQSMICFLYWFGTSFHCSLVCDMNIGMTIHHGHHLMNDAGGRNIRVRNMVFGHGWRN